MDFSEREFIRQTRQARLNGQSDVRGAAIVISIILVILAFLIGYTTGQNQADRDIAQAALESK